MSTQIYNVFLEVLPEPKFLFSFKQDINRRPKKGDVLTRPFSFEQLKIIRDETPESIQNAFRLTEGGLQRATEDGDIRVTGFVSDPETAIHNYFVTPANNPNRIDSWSTAGFANDQTLKQLFR